MITSRDIRDKKFEKAAFGYKQEEIDDFLDELEREFVEIENERDENNSKIQILADKVREFMHDEDALKDALLDAQKQGHRIIAEANERADQIVADAQKKADDLMEEATTKHDQLMAKNRLEIEKEKKNLLEARKEVSDFKKKLFDMYKEHLAKVSLIPEVDAKYFERESAKLADDMERDEKIKNGKKDEPVEKTDDSIKDTAKKENNDKLSK